jgi:hypothetical protein
MSSQSKQIVLSPSEWDTTAIKYMKPYVTKSGSKTISIISKQTNRSLTISTPFMMTWGCSDYTDANGDSDGRFNVSLNFPNDSERTDQTDLFLKKIKDFENQILNDAVKNSDTWWGKSMSREICEFTFFPMLKYSKNKDTQAVDYNKPPSMRAKVPTYEGSWKVEIYNTKGEMIFPSENSDETPDTIITKLSHVACVLQSGGIWIGGKGWGITWKLVQCAIKPKEIVSITGRCLISLPPMDFQAPAASSPQSQVPQIVEPVVVNNTSYSNAVVAAAKQSSVEAEDTDDEKEEEETTAPEAPPAPVSVEPETKVVEGSVASEPVGEANSEDTEEAVVPPPPPAQAPVPVKKVIKKTVAPVVNEVAQQVEEAPAATEVPKKKVVKKVVAK